MPGETDRSESEFSTLVENSTDIIIRFDTDLRRVYANPAFERQFGMPGSAILGKTVLEASAAPESGDAAYRALQKALDTGLQQDVERSFESPSGTRYYHTRIMPECSADGRVVSLITVTRDITERKQMEEELRSSEERYRSLFHQTHDAIFILDFEGRHLIANERATEMLGYTLEELLQLSFRDTSAELSESEDVLARLCAGEHVPLYERLFRKKNGEVFPVEITAELVRDRNGNPIHIQCVVRDITKRRQAEDREREQRALAEALRATAETLNSSLRLADILERILDHIGRVVRYDAMTIAWIEGDCLRVVGSRGYSPEQERLILAQKIPLDQLSAFTEAIETRQPVIIPDTAVYPHWEASDLTAGIHSHIKVPIAVDGAVVGLINLSSKSFGAYAASDARILQAFANQAALAVRNAMLYEEVQQLAIVDELTGVCNRRGFFEACRREVGRMQRFDREFSMLFVDIDHFKEFNDRHSYTVGDRVLRHVARTLHGNVREIDLVGRYGGEEFVVLLPESHLVHALHVAERLRAAVEAIRLPSTHGDLSVTVSIGVATHAPVPGHAGVADAKGQEDILNDLIARAGQALHLAKQQGRNRVVS